jgi:hypothetical protein
MEWSARIWGLSFAKIITFKAQILPATGRVCEQSILKQTFVVLKQS